MCLLLCMFFAGVASWDASAQERTITGTVVDSDGVPIIGASLIVEGGQDRFGTITDHDGNFTLEVPD